MNNEECKQEIESHQNDIETLYTLSPEIESHQAEISRFFLSYPGLIGISYPAAEVLMREKDADIRTEAIKRVIVEKKKRCDVNAPGFCFVRRSVSENQVRRILRTIKTKDTPVIDKTTREDTRSKVISFRATESEEDAIEFVANNLCVSKSLIIDVLLKVANRFGIALKEIKK